MPTCYLGGPIHGCDDAACVSWRKRAARLLEAQGWRAVDPLTRTGDWRGEEERYQGEIVEGDKQTIEQVDVVLVNFQALGPEVHGHGSAMEILWAWLAHKPIVIVWPHDYPCPVWDSYHAIRDGGGVYRRLDDAVLAIPSLFSIEQEVAGE